MGKIAQKICSILLTVIILSVGVDALYRHTYNLTYQWPQNLWIMPEIEQKYEIVKVGNSHADTGIRFEGYTPRSLSLSGVAQSFDYDLANVKMYSRQIKTGAVIIINASPISFSQEKNTSDDSFQTMYYDGRLSPFLIPNLKVEDYIQSQIFPFLRSGPLWRKKYDNQIRERIAKEEKWQEATPTPTPIDAPEMARESLITETGKTIPASSEGTVPKTDNFIPANIANPAYYLHVNAIKRELASPDTTPPDMLQNSMNFMFNKWYRTSGFGTQYFAANRNDLEKLIEYCLKKKWRPVVITIPISKVLTDGLLPDYMQTYVYDNVAKTNLHGAEYINFQTNEQLTQKKYLFGNSDHLNDKGATIFSYLLLQTLIDRGYLPEEADGYDYGLK